MKLISIILYCFGFYYYHSYFVSQRNRMRGAYDDFCEEKDNYWGDPDDPYWIERKKELESDIEYVTDLLKFAEPYVKSNLIVGVIAIALNVIGTILELVFRCVFKNKKETNPQQNMEMNQIYANNQLNQIPQGIVLVYPQQYNINQGMTVYQSSPTYSSQ